MGWCAPILSTSDTEKLSGPCRQKRRIIGTIFSMFRTTSFVDNRMRFITKFVAGLASLIREQGPVSAMTNNARGLERPRPLRGN